MVAVVLLIIFEIIAALIAAAVVVVVILVVVFFPPMSVRPLGRIDFLDAHPRHVCSGDMVTVNWRGDGDSGILTAASLGPFSPFYSETIDASRASMGRSSFDVTIDTSFNVYLELRRGTTSPFMRNVTVINNASPNSRIPLTVALTFTRDPIPGWVGTRVLASDPLIDVDDWSPSIHVTGLEYPLALPTPGAPRPTRDMVRDVTVSWEGRELVTLSVDHPDHIHTPEEVTAVGEWRLFVLAGPDDGPDTVLQSITINLMPRCVRR
jgi:hypothetical protein